MLLLTQLCKMRIRLTKIGHLSGHRRKSQSNINKSINGNQPERLHRIPLLTLCTQCEREWKDHHWLLHGLVRHSLIWRITHDNINSPASRYRHLVFAVELTGVFFFVVVFLGKSTWVGKYTRTMCVRNGWRTYISYRGRIARFHYLHSSN